MREGKMTIGTELKAVMEKEGITGYRLSQETGLSETYISKLLHNKMNPTYRTLKCIADFLGYRICFERISQGKEVKTESKVSQKRPKRRR
jgi:transcriptional regulator with XRE-family HTH domain